MKAERRHQLQANELAKQLETFPETLKRNATTILLIVTAFVVVFFLMRYRKQAAQNRATLIGTSMLTARQGPMALRQMEQMTGAPEQVASARAQIISETNSSIDNILRDAEGDNAPALRAEALIARGDLNWELANTQPLSAATTRPALKLPKTTDEYLKAAEDTYKDVASAYSGQIVSWVTAQFGLAAIAENRGDWESAKKAYQAVTTNKSVPDVFRAQADLRINWLARLAEPTLIGPFPATAPTINETAIDPATPVVPMQLAPAPSTQPTTAPAGQ